MIVDDFFKSSSHAKDQRWNVSLQSERRVQKASRTLNHECMNGIECAHERRFSGTMHDEDRHKRTIMLIYPCFLGIALWDVLVLRTL